MSAYVSLDIHGRLVPGSLTSRAVLFVCCTWSGSTMTLKQLAAMYLYCDAQHKLAWQDRYRATLK